MPTYYTYRSFEEFDSGRSYIGVRKCPTGKTPETDSYLGSYTDKTFSPTAKEILGVYYSKEEALQAEIDLHKKFDVARNPHFSNRACATSTGFCISSHSEETKRKMSAARSGENHPQYTPRDWYHPSHGKVLQKSISELMEMFPEQNLNDSNLSSVALGKNPHHKGWRLLKNKNKNLRKSGGVGIPRDWHHPVHGTVLQRSASELVKRFPEQNLNQSTLRVVALEKRSRHKGWRPLKNKDKNVRNRGGVNIPRDWFHPIHGEVLQKSVIELIRLFPEQNLGDSSLSQVALGKRSHHKVWRLSKNKNKKVSYRGVNIPRDWFHPVHGEVLQKSLSELMEMFPGENLDKSSLSRVALGKRPHHKRWRVC